MRLVAVMAGAIALMATGASAQQKAAGGDEAAIAKIRTAYQTAVSSHGADQLFGGLLKVIRSESVPDGSKRIGSLEISLSIVEIGHDLTRGLSGISAHRSGGPTRSRSARAFRTPGDRPRSRSVGSERDRPAGA